MINPLFHYCYPVFSDLNRSWNSKFESLKSRAKRIVGLDYTVEWPSLEVERNRKIALDVFKILNNIDKINHQKYERFDHKIQTRGNGCLLKIPKVRTKSGRKTTSHQGALIFNKLPANLRQEKSLLIFKRSLEILDF